MLSSSRSDIQVSLSNSSTLIIFHDYQMTININITADNFLFNISICNCWYLSSCYFNSSFICKERDFPFLVCVRTLVPAELIGLAVVLTVKEDGTFVEIFVDEDGDCFLDCCCCSTSMGMSWHLFRTPLFVGSVEVLWIEFVLVFIFVFVLCSEGVIFIELPVIVKLLLLLLSLLLLLIFILLPTEVIPEMAKLLNPSTPTDPVPKGGGIPKPHPPLVCGREEFRKLTPSFSFSLSTLCGSFPVS